VADEKLLAKNMETKGAPDKKDDHGLAIMKRLRLGDNPR